MPEPTDLFSILPDEEKRKIVRDVYKRHAEAMSSDVVRAEVLKRAAELAPALAKEAVECFARELTMQRTGYGRYSDNWGEIVRKAIREGVVDFLDKHDVALTPKPRPGPAAKEETT